MSAFPHFFASAPGYPERMTCDDGSSPLGPRYPLNQSFVLQIERAGDTATLGLLGRIEHVSTGEARQFDCAEALLRFIDAIIGRQAPQAASADSLAGRDPDEQ
jgi:hypothetical protein